MTIIIAIIILCVLVTVHEFGHFISARIFGVTVHEFAIGMGPAIYKRQGKNTLFSVRILPLGGFCKMEGEDTDSDDPGSFNNCKKWQKIIILASGALMNIILGYIVAVIIMFQSQTVYVPVVKDLLPDFPAQQVMQVGDEIIKVNGKRIYTAADVNIALIGETGESDFVIKRGGEKIELSLAPKENDEGNLLFGYSNSAKNLNFFNRFFYGYRTTVNYSKLILTSLGDLVTGKVGMENLSGPAGIVGGIGDAVSSSKEEVSLIPLLSFIAFLTINLGVFNLIPFPALDGGRILFVLASLIIRKEIPPEKEGIVHFIGLLLLFGLVIFATRNDIIRMFAG